jgi:hypothetical protein
VNFNESTFSTISWVLSVVLIVLLICGLIGVYRVLRVLQALLMLEGANRWSLKFEELVEGVNWRDVSGRPIVRFHTLI